MTDLGAFLPEPRLRRPPTRSGPLDGLTFAVKDLFDVAGHVTGCGNPDWASSHPAATRDAWAVRRLLDHGAAMNGKTVTDEISLGLLGSNRFFGTPLNPIASGLYPGGSSSGSAVAVAAGEVDCALGSDSGGSVRVPASFLGLYGLRPTHGLIPVEGLMTQAKSFDTVGFFARDAETFWRVGDVLLPEAETAGPIDTVLIAADAIERCDPAVREAAVPVIDRVAETIGTVRRIVLADDGLARWGLCQGQVQPAEFAETFWSWVDAVNPRLSYEVARALVLGRLATHDERLAGSAVRTAVTRRLRGLLKADTILCLPTTPILPPPRTASLSMMNEAVARLVELTCIAGLAGLPQISLPLARSDGQPVGISFIGAPGSDRSLLRLARRIGSDA